MQPDDPKATPTSITQFWMDRIIAERQAEAVTAERARIKPLMDTIREALRIGAICFEGDSWFVSRDALGDTGYDDLDDAEKVLADARAAVLAIIGKEND